MSKNNANPNIMHVDIISNLIIDIYGHIEAISSKTVQQQGVKDEAKKTLSQWEKEDLHNLRKAFE